MRNNIHIDCIPDILVATLSCSSALTQPSASSLLNCGRDISKAFICEQKMREQHLQVSRITIGKFENMIRETDLYTPDRMKIHTELMNLRCSNCNTIKFGSYPYTEKFVCWSCKNKVCKPFSMSM